MQLQSILFSEAINDFFHTLLISLISAFNHIKIYDDRDAYEENKENLQCGSHLNSWQKM